MNAPRLAELLDRSRLIVLVGEGGVGKTTTAAALALAAAERGRKTTVLTIDPAPRLGDALGIGPLGAEPTEVDLGDQVTGSLLAMRLDAKGVFDQMVERFAPSATAARTMLANPIYQAVSGSLGGSEAYMAFQRLYELLEDCQDERSEQDTQELLIVDTPPAASCNELFAAPQRLAGLFDTGALSVLAEPSNLVARSSSMVARASLRAVLTIVQRVAGAELHRNITEFSGLTEQLLLGLQGRTAAIDAMLRREATSFVLVTRPTSDNVATTLSFQAALADMGIEPRALIVNRVTPPRERAQQGSPDAAGTPETPRSGASSRLADRATAAASAMEADLDHLRSAETFALQQFRSLQAPPADRPRLLVLENTETEVATLDDLRRLSQRLLRGA
jgi:anion-transporting  ArsA/GET3 family ATPase